MNQNEKIMKNIFFKMRLFTKISVINEILMLIKKTILRWEIA